MADAREAVRFHCSFPPSAFEEAASESLTFLRELLGDEGDPQRGVTLVFEGGLLNTTLAVACHSRRIRKRVREGPAVTEIALPSELSSRAVEALFHLIEHHELNLSCPELEPLCAAVKKLNMPSVHTALRQASNGLLAAAECQGPACVQALLQDIVRLGRNYHLPGLVDLGVEKSLSLVPQSAQEAHFRAMPAEVQSLALLRRHLASEDCKRDRRDSAELWERLRAERSEQRERLNLVFNGCTLAATVLIGFFALKTANPKAYKIGCRVAKTAWLAARKKVLGY